MFCQKEKKRNNSNNNNDEHYEKNNNNNNDMKNNESLSCLFLQSMNKEKKYPFQHHLFNHKQLIVMNSKKQH